MTWVAWRQLRMPALAGAAGFGVLALFLVVTGLRMSSAFDASGLGDCVRTQPACGLVAEQFRQRFAGLSTIAPYFQFLPALIGVFLGAPLVAREFEQGTHRLVFTQSVTRLRWITVKLILTLLLATIGALAVSRVVAWWYRPFAELGDGRFTPEVFSHEGVVPVAYTIFAVALGVAAGTILRRSIPAMALTIAIFFAVRFSVGSWLRPRYLAPHHATQPLSDGFGTGNGDWSLSSQFVDRLGHPVAMQNVAAVCPPGANTPQCLRQQGLLVLETYQPAGRFWLFQAIEAGIFLALAAVLIALTIHQLRRRLS